jgi:hypothetical protein
MIWAKDADLSAQFEHKSAPTSCFDWSEKSAYFS